MLVRSTGHRNQSPSPTAAVGYILNTLNKSTRTI